MGCETLFRKSVIIPTRNSQINVSSNSLAQNGYRRPISPIPMSIPSHQSSTSSTPDQSDIVRLPSPVSSSGQVNIRKKSEPSSRPVTRQSIRASVREFIFNNPLVNKRNSSENSLSRVGQSFRIKCSPSSDEGKSDRFSGIDRQDSREDTKRKKSKESPFEECALCFDEYPPEQLATLMSCDHKPCRTCLAQYLKIEISESRVMVACPECDTPVHPNDIYSIVTDRNLLDKYEDFMVRRVLVADPDTRWCPAPDCGYAVIAAGCAGCPNLKCERPGCGMEFCYHCKAEWHPDQTCDAARSGRKTRSGREGSFIGSLGEQLTFSQDRLRHCPRCSVLIMKVDDGSCNHMTCAVCGAEFCWLCMKEISDLHYLSPSGCTFWGKKPWSKKKKILWQVGTLIGAPVGIALLAGIAIPGIVIGVPFWVGRKLSTRSKKKKPRNKAVVATAVVASIFISPFLAALAVALGVPICLAYVYGVVPISLCRSGGCGGSTSSKSGMKMELDGNPDLLPYGAQSKHSELSVSDIGTERKPDSSSQVDVSLGMSSHSVASGRCAEAGCHDAGSNTAQAGGSYCKRFDGTCETNSKRMSLTSETVSESERSVTLSCADDCSSSTRGFAGSVLNYKFSHARNPGNASHTPAEVYIDGRAATVPEENGSAGDFALVLMRRSCKKGRTNTNKQVVCEQEGEKSQDHVIDVEVCDEPAYMTPPEDHFRHSSRTDLKSLAVSIATQLSDEVLRSPVLTDQVAVSVSVENSDRK